MYDNVVCLTRPQVCHLCAWRAWPRNSSSTHWVWHTRQRVTLRRWVHKNRALYCHLPLLRKVKASVSVASTQWRTFNMNIWSQLPKIFTYVIHHVHHNFPSNDRWGIWSWQKRLKWSNTFHFLSISMFPWQCLTAFRAKSKPCYTSTLPGRELLYHTVSSRERWSLRGVWIYILYIIMSEHRWGSPYRRM